MSTDSHSPTSPGESLGWQILRASVEEKFASANLDAWIGDDLTKLEQELAHFATPITRSPRRRR